MRTTALLVIACIALACDGTPDDAAEADAAPGECGLYLRACCNVDAGDGCAGTLACWETVEAERVCSSCGNGGEPCCPFGAPCGTGFACVAGDIFPEECREEL